MDEKYQDIEMNGRTFRVHKLPARKALAMVKLSTLVRKNPPKSESPEDVAECVYNLFGEMDEDTYDYFYKIAMSVTYEIRPNNPMPVSILNDNGTFGVPDLEDDTATVFELMMMALLFNLNSFLSANPSVVLRGGTSDSNP